MKKKIVPWIPIIVSTALSILILVLLLVDCYILRFDRFRAFIDQITHYSDNIFEKFYCVISFFSFLFAPFIIGFIICCAYYIPKYFKLRKIVENDNIEQYNEEQKAKQRAKIEAKLKKLEEKKKNLE